MLLQKQKKGDKDITSRSINILIIEDNEGDVRLIREMLKDVSNLSFKVEASGLLIKALKILESRKFDAILLDLNLPDSVGIETVSKTLEVIRDTPIIILTGLNEESLAISTVKMGAQDYLVKEQLNNMLLARSIQYAIERKKTEQKLKESEEKYKNLFEQSPMAILLINFEGIIEDCNTPTEVLFGYTKEEILGNEFLKFDYFPLDSKLILVKSFSKFLKTRVPEHSEILVYRKDGKKVWIKSYPIIVKIADISYILVVIQDITERKKTEEEIANLARFPSENPYPVSRVTKEKVIYLNNAGETIFGIKEGDTLPELVSDVVAEAIEEGVVKVLELEFNNRIYSLDIAPIKEEGYTNIYGRDITERKKVEKKIIESEAKYRDLLETAVMGLLEVDLRVNKISYINPKLLEIFGYRKEALIDEFFAHKIIHPDDNEKVFKSHEEREFEFRIYTENRTLKWLSGIRKNIYNEEGELIKMRLWLMDITEKKELEEIKNNLLTRFSHEFKTPLISIKGFADFLLTEHNKNLDDKTISFLKKIKDGGDRLKELVNSFIESSQLDNALIKLKLHQENLSNLIKTGLEEMQGLINLREHTIILDIHDQLIASVDKEKIYSVITNLLINAVKYTPKGGKIWIQSIINEGSIIVSVKDNGIGLDDIDKKQLFKPFGKIERYGKGWDIISEGMGMGLCLSKEITNLHGGKIWVESKGRNEGSTFYFSLPIDIN